MPLNLPGPIIEKTNWPKVPSSNGPLESPGGFQLVTSLTVLIGL